MDEALLREAARMHQEVEQLERHRELLNNEIIELSKFRQDFEGLDEASGREILASAGRGVFLPARAIGGDFLVSVGAGVVIRKKSSEIKEVIESQIRNIHMSKVFIDQQAEMKFSALQEIIQKIEKKEQ